MQSSEFRYYLDYECSAQLLQSYLALCDPLDCGCIGSLSMEFSRKEYTGTQGCQLSSQVFLSQGWSPCLLAGRWILYQCSPGKPTTTIPSKKF